MERGSFREELVVKARRVVVKIGSSVLTHHSEIIDEDVIRALVDEMSTLMDEGKEVVVVTSGAVAAGIMKLGIKKKLLSIPEKQAAAAAGQSSLIRYYEKSFEKNGKKVAQILLTGDGLSKRGRYLNARNTISALLHYGVVPVINENDTVAVDEIRFGDNDNLSAMVTGLSDADLLVMLTDTDGLYNKDPRVDDSAELIGLVTDFEEQTKGASDATSGVGTGGMTTKVEAARMASSFGVPTVIANGERSGVLCGLLNGEEVGTLFAPGESRIKGKKKWIAYSLEVAGSIVVDSGARLAIVEGKSLLPSGIVGVQGSFGFGDSVSLAEDGQGEFARGLVQFNSLDIDRIKGLKTSDVEKALGKKEYDEVVHRDDMVLI